MRFRVFVTVAALTVSLTYGLADARPHPATAASLASRRARPHPRSDELYAPRARRRFAAYLRMRLLEMREAGLERAADVVERRLSVDALVPPREKR